MGPFTLRVIQGLLVIVISGTVTTKKIYFGVLIKFKDKKERCYVFDNIKLIYRGMFIKDGIGIFIIVIE